VVSETSVVTDPQRSAMQSYVRAKQLELAATLAERKAVYLDVKFWIILRDVAMGERNAAREKELLLLLRDLVHRGVIFCPISDTVFIELLKKTDLRRRQVVADLIDEMSLGVSLIPFDMRGNTELAHLLHAARSPESVYPLEQLVWTKLAYVMGFSQPQFSCPIAAHALEIQTGFVDHMWTISLREMMDRLGTTTFLCETRFEKLAENLNAANQQHAAELRSFEQTYQTEVHGMLDVFEESTVDIVEQMVFAEHGIAPPGDPEQRREHGRQLHNLLFAALQRTETRQTLRSLHIVAMLFAYVRWNAGQRLRANDFHDYYHAAGALGYCDAFFTERSLRASITAAHMALDKQFQCNVSVSTDEAIVYLKSL
jgi:hypothetical protein